MTTPRRYYVSLTVRCDGDSLHACLDRLAGVVPTLAEDMPDLGSASLSYSLDQDGEYDSTTVALRTDLPPAGPVTSTGPGTPPPDAVDMPVPEPALDTSWRAPEPTVDELPPAGQHTDPEPQS